MITCDRSMRHFDQDGRLHVERTIISIANVCPYYGVEIPGYQELGLDPAKTYRLYRDPAELEKAAPSYHNVPLMVKHIAVSAEQPKKESISGVVSNIEFENPNLFGSLAVWTQEGIDLIESEEAAQLSAGYYFKADMTPGVTPSGEPYDGRMTQMACNHVAQVELGRVGPKSAVADQLPERLPMKSKYAKFAPFLATDADIAAFDKAMDEEKEKAEDAAKEEAEDMANNCYGNSEDEWKDMSAKDKKKARDEWKKAEDKKAADAKAAADKKAKDATPAEPEDDPKKKGMDAKDGKITKAELDKLLAQDRAAHRNEIMAAVDALAQARADVAPLVGKIALDSAEAVYAYALKKNGIEAEGWPLAALKANVESLKARSTPAKPKLATDSASAGSLLLSVFPGLNRFHA